jgi:hypothetical protein
VFVFFDKHLFLQCIVQTSVSFGIINEPLFRDLLFAVNENCIVPTSDHIRKQTLPHLYVDCQRDVADDLAGDGPLALLADGTTRRLYRLEVFMGE